MKFNKEESVLPLCKQKLGELSGEYSSVLYCDVVSMGEGVLPKYISLVHRTEGTSERVRYVQEASSVQMNQEVPSVPAIRGAGTTTWLALEALSAAIRIKHKPIAIGYQVYRMIMQTALALKLEDIDLYTFHGKYFVCCSFGPAYVEE